MIIDRIEYAYERWNWKCTFNIMVAIFDFIIAITDFFLQKYWLSVALIICGIMMLHLTKTELSQPDYLGYND